MKLYNVTIPWRDTSVILGLEAIDEKDALEQAQESMGVEDKIDWSKVVIMEVP